MMPKQETTPFTMYWPAHWYVFCFLTQHQKKKKIIIIIIIIDENTG